MGEIVTVLTAASIGVLIAWFVHLHWHLHWYFFLFLPSKVKNNKFSFIAKTNRTVVAWLYFHKLAQTPPHANRVLLVTAHPDDECMFFTPTILHFVNNGAKVAILCLSNGKNHAKSNRVENKCILSLCPSISLV
jgi:hypothetical protein